MSRVAASFPLPVFQTAGKLFQVKSAANGAYPLKMLELGRGTLVPRLNSQSEGSSNIQHWLQLKALKLMKTHWLHVVGETVNGRTFLYIKIENHI